MSDYRPPGAPKTIIDMPEECIRLIFIPLPLIDLMNAGQVCKLWNTLQKSVCLTKKCLILLIGKNTSLKWLYLPWYHQNHSPRSRYNLTNVLDETGKPMMVDTLVKDFWYDGLKSEKMVTQMIKSLKLTFKNVTVITIACESASKVLFDQIIRLLTKLGPQLITLKLSLNITFQHQQTLYTTINALEHLKILHLSFTSGSSNRFPFGYDISLPILTQLEQFHFHTIADNSRIAQLWVPILESLDVPLRVTFTKGTIRGHWHNFNQDNDIPPKSAAMFSHFPRKNFDDLQHLKQFTAKFSNLVVFEFETYNFPVPGLLAALSKLKSLVSLRAQVQFSLDFVHQDSQAQSLPQLPSVKLFSLYQNQYSHADLTRWNISWTMPNLQVLFVDHQPYNYICCSDCKYGSVQTPVQIKRCFRVQLRDLKHQCGGKLRAAHFFSYNASVRISEIEEDAEEVIFCPQ